MNSFESFAPERSAKKTLIIRLSSLGDVIMAASALEALPADVKADWVVSAEYADLISTHPKVSRVWRFDRRKGFRGWVRLCRELWREGYDEVLDLHSNLRSRIAGGLFAVWGWKTRRKPQWRRVSKQRIRSYGYYVFKKAWPKRWRPQLWVTRHALIAGGTGQERPDLSHLVREAGEVRLPESDVPYLSLMPSAKWQGKKWPVSRFAEICRSLKGTVLPIVLGTGSDGESAALAALLAKEGFPHFSGVGAWDLKQVASVLARSACYLGNDTGLAYLAESVGTRAVVVFGPTASDLGFGPWGERSRGAGSALWCRPCGKDGRNCFRVRRRYLCLAGLGAGDVLAEVEAALGE